MVFRRVFACAVRVRMNKTIRSVSRDTFHERRTREAKRQNKQQQRNHCTDARHQLCFISLRPFRFEPVAQSSHRGTGLPDASAAEWWMVRREQGERGRHTGYRGSGSPEYPWRGKPRSGPDTAATTPLKEKE